MEFKILLVGEGGVGKGSFVHMCKNGYFNNTAPINNSIHYCTNYGIIHLILTQSHKYEKGYDAELIMIDSTKFATMKILRQIPDNIIPKIVMGNKFDLQCSRLVFPKVKQQEITSRKYPYFNISVKMQYGIRDVLLCLLKKLVANDIQLY